MSRYAAIYQNFFQIIGRPLKKEDGMAPKSWQSIGINVPIAIAEFFEVAGNATDFTRAYNRFLFPNEWFQDETMNVILEENQGVSVWGYRIIDQDLENPDVYYALAEDYHWSSFEISWSEYILLELCMQMVFGEDPMPFLDSIVLTEELADTINDSWQKVGQWGDRSAFIGPNCILCFLDWEQDRRLFIGSQRRKIISEIGHQLGVKWDRQLPW